MRIAILSDIHGNPIALDAVIHDVERQGGVDAYWILGDLVAIGHGPVQVLERLSQLPNVQFIRGNTDRYVCTGDRPPPTLDETKNDPALLPALIEVAATFAWTQGAITGAGWFEWLCRLPIELRATLQSPRGDYIIHEFFINLRNLRFIFVDANAIAPQRAIRIGDAMAERGVAFIDGGIIGGPAWEPNTTWLYLRPRLSPPCSFQRSEGNTLM